VKMWDTESGACLQTYDAHSGNVTACAWLPDGQAFLTGSDDKCAPARRPAARAPRAAVPASVHWGPASCSRAHKAALQAVSEAPPER